MAVYSKNQARTKRQREFSVDDVTRLLAQAALGVPRSDGNIDLFGDLLGRKYEDTQQGY